MTGEYNKLNKDFYEYAANLLETKPDTVKKYWLACVDTIIHMLHFDGRCQMPGVGRFDLKEIPEWNGIAKNDAGELVERTNPAWFKIIYTVNEDFLNNVNGRGVTRKYRKRVRERKLTKNDLKLLSEQEITKELLKTQKERQEEREAQRKAAAEAKFLAKIQAAKERDNSDFLDVINQKKEEHKRKLEEMKNEDEQSTADTTSD